MVRSDHGCANAVDDQLTFNQLIWGERPAPGRAEPIYPVRAAREDGRAIFDGTGMRVVAPLSARQVCSGHVFHVQQAVEPRECLVMHLTFVEAGSAGKVWRLREAGMWRFEPEPTVSPVASGAGLTQPSQPQQTQTQQTQAQQTQAQQTPPEPQHQLRPSQSQPQSQSQSSRPLSVMETMRQIVYDEMKREQSDLKLQSQSQGGAPRPRRFLSFTPPEPAAHVPPERLPSQSAHEPIPNRTKEGWSIEAAIQYVPRLAAHLELVDRHIVAIRNAMAVARALGRELIMPRMLCLCERAQQPWGVLPGCVKDGASSTPLPFVCPIEYIFDVEELEDLWKSGYLTLRPWTMLNSSFHAQAPEAKALRAAVTTVRWHEGGPSEGGLSLEGGSVLRLPRGLTDVGWRAALADQSDAPVLHLESAHEGAVFAGFEDDQEGAVFESKIRSHVVPGTRRFSATWCCTTTHYQAGTILYKRPWALPRGAAARDGKRAAMAAAAHAAAPRPCYWEHCYQVLRHRLRMPDDI